MWGPSSEARVDPLKFGVYLNIWDSSHVEPKRAREHLRNPRKENPGSLHNFAPRRPHNWPPDGNISKVSFRFVGIGHGITGSSWLES